MPRVSIRIENFLAGSNLKSWWLVIPPFDDFPEDSLLNFPQPRALVELPHPPLRSPGYGASCVGLVETRREFCAGCFFLTFHEPLKMYWLLGRHELLKLT